MASFQKFVASSNKKKIDKFRHQIRSNKLQEIFSEMRIQFSISNSQSTTISSISSIKHLQSILRRYNETGTNLDFSDINQFIIQVQQILPQELQKQIIQIIFSNHQYLSDCRALSTLCNMINRENFNLNLLTQEFIDGVVYKLIPANQDQNSKRVNMEEQFIFIENCELICYLIHTIRLKNQSQFNFSGLAKYRSDIQNSCDIFCPQYLCMIASLSINSALLPSQRVIRQFLTMKIQQTKDQRELCFIVETLQNYIRHSKNENIQLLLMYIKFISIQLSSGLFPARLKIEMINLFTTLIRCPSQEVFDALFEDQNTLAIFKLIVMRVKFQSMEYQIISCLLSITTFIQIMSRQQLIKCLEEEESVVEVLVGGLQISDEFTVMRLLITLNKLLECIPNIKQQMIQHQILQKMSVLQFNQSKRIFQVVQCLYDMYFQECGNK